VGSLKTKLKARLEMGVPGKVDAQGGEELKGTMINAVLGHYAIFGRRNTATVTHKQKKASGSGKARTPFLPRP